MNKQIEDENHIQEAEWEEVSKNSGEVHFKRPQASDDTSQSANSDKTNIPNSKGFTPWMDSGFWRDTLKPSCLFPTAVFMLFVLIISVSNCNGATGLNPDENIPSQSDEALGLSEDWLTGNWVMTPKGGADGQTSCSDFNTATLYNLNGKTATLTSFGPSGKYRSLFAYTTPSGEEHTQIETAVWSIESNIISYVDVNLKDSFGGVGVDRKSAAHMNGENVLTIDYKGAQNRYVRCVGDVDDMLRSNPTSNAQPPQQQPYTYHPTKFDLNSLCSDQETVNSMLTPFKSAVGQVLLSVAPNAASMGLDEAIIRAYMIGDHLKKSKFKFLNIRSLGVTGEGTETVTVRCVTNLRLVEPVDDTNGVWSTYLQFNNAHYSIRIKNADTDQEEAYLLAEIRPVDGKWDIVSGTE